MKKLSEEYEKYALLFDSSDSYFKDNSELNKAFDDRYQKNIYSGIPEIEGWYLEYNKKYTITSSFSLLSALISEFRI